MRWISLAALFLAPSAAYSAKLDAALFDQRIEQLMQDEGIIGLSAVVVEKGKRSHLRSFGSTYIGGEPVTENTVFRWASISKTAAATLAATLEEEGVIDLNQPIEVYNNVLALPNQNQKTATLTHLLSHQLGITHHAYDWRLEKGTAPNVIQADLAGLKQICPPGNCFAYQNVAFDTISDIISEQKRELYPALLQSYLFGPLKMKNASVGNTALTTSESFARPHHKRSTSNVRQEITTESTYYRLPAAAGVNSSILDLEKYMKAQMGMSPKVISEDVIERIQTPQIITTGRGQPVRSGQSKQFLESYYGLGWRINDYAGHRVISHTGSVNGYGALLLFDPEIRTGLALLWNASTRKPYRLQAEFLHHIYDLEPVNWD